MAPGHGGARDGFENWNRRFQPILREKRTNITNQSQRHKASREFQVFAKPIGSICNLNCHYCYYLKKEQLYPKGESFRMPDEVLEKYIAQHIEASPNPAINFHWHGGEPTVLGLDYFRKIVTIERKYQPPGRIIRNGIQTNGTLLDEDWCRFLAAEDFTVGLSLDGPREMHDKYRVTKDQKPTHKQAMRGYKLLRQHQVACDILCVVNAYNVRNPIQVYRFFKQIKAKYVGFLPLVEREPDAVSGVSERTVPAKALGAFLCAIFDEWKTHDIGQVIVQNIEEVAKTALGQEHALCIFRKTCGDCPVVEHNGDFFSCDHFVDAKHRLGNISETSLADLLESPAQRRFGQAKFDTIPRYCRECEVLVMCHGGCPKDRFIKTPDGEAGLNYLCEGYKSFFNHCRPFVTELAAQRRRRSLEPQTTQGPAPSTRTRPKTGRNDPCPCGSGRKYKKCCLGK